MQRCGPVEYKGCMSAALLVTAAAVILLLCFATLAVLSRIAAGMRMRKHRIHLKYRLGGREYIYKQIKTRISVAYLPLR